MSIKNLKIVSIIFIFVLLFNFSFTFATNDDNETLIKDDISTGSEETPVNGEQATQEENKTEDDKWIYEDYYMSGDNITVDKIIDGNAFISGSTVTISGEIGGDLFVVAEKVIIESGYIYSNLFVVTQELIINGIVYDLYGCASNITLSDEGLIARDFRAFANNVTINGQINRNAYISVNESLSISDTCSISGNLKYSVPSEINVPEGVVNGEISSKITTPRSKTPTVSSLFESILGLLFYTIVVAFFTLKFAPKFVDNLVERFKAPQTYIYGLLTLILAPIVIVLLLVTFIGIKLSLLLTLLYLLLITLSTAIVNITVGKLISNKLSEKSGKVFTPMNCIILTTIALWILDKIPYINVFTSLLIFIAGFSLLIPSFKSKKQKDS
ncbi:MAG: hypothetical protein Q4G05_01185 [Clostridia bacterium]|nr:hypothetical protein [Clostridia bacterium]